MINRTSWEPSARFTPLIGKTLKRLDGTTLTDVDAVAQLGAHLLLLDNKSFPETHEVAIGRPAETRARRERVERASRSWANKIAYIDAHPEILHVDVHDVTISGVVLTPGVPFVSLGVATEQTPVGLRRSSSLEEFRDLLLGRRQ